MENYSQQQNHQQQKQRQQQQNNTGRMQNQSQNDTGNSASGVRFSFEMDKPTREDAFMRRPRSQAYMDIIASIDLLSATDKEIIEKLKGLVDEETLEEFQEMSPEELLEELRLSFAEEMSNKLEQLKKLSEPQELQGVLSQCFIAGCDVHAIDAQGNILEHFKQGRDMPKALAPGRTAYYRHRDCSCVEVYNNCCRVIMTDGSVVTIMNHDL